MKDLLHVLHHGVGFLSSMHGYGLSLYQYEPLSRKIKIRYAECTCVAG
jgi:stage III sporulation protein SpoIIIAA